MRNKVLVRVTIVLIVTVLMVGCGGAGPKPTGGGVEYMWEKYFTIFPIEAQNWVLHPEPHPEFKCWIWGEYWVNKTQIQGQFFLARGVKASSASCSGVINGG